MSAAKGFRNVLRDDADVTALTGSYLSYPSIFAESIPPADFAIKPHGPFILIGPSVSAVREDGTGVTLGAQSNFRARIYAETDETAEALADAVESALHGSTPIVSGCVVRGVIAEPSGPAPTDTPSVIGRQIPIRLFYERA